MKQYLDKAGLQKLQEQIDSLYARKTELQTLKESLENIDVKIFKVDTSLDAANKEDGKIHLVKSSLGNDDNWYNEYIYTNDKWELIGQVNIAASVDGDINETVKEQIGVFETTLNNLTTKITDLTTRVKALEDTYIKSEDHVAITDDEIIAMFNA